MNEQLSLFTIHPVQVAKPKIDPYWDEITARQPEIDDDTVNSVSSSPSASKFQNEEPGLKGLGNSVSPSLFTDKNVRAQDTQPQQTILKEFAPEHTHWTEEYWVKRGNKKHYYLRYCWMVGRKKQRLHIGSVTNPVARAKREEVEIAIADGESPEYIRQLLKPQS